MKKVFALLMIAVLLLSITGCGSNTDTAQLQEEIAELQRQVEDLSARLQALEQNSGLKSWDLQASAASSDTVTVTLTATPVAYVSGQIAHFQVCLDGQEMASTQCAWDGASYTASLDLPAEDGYSYYCILTAADGTSEQIALNTPENPVSDALVYLASSLSAYGNVIVEDWKYDADNLTLISGYIQVQTPRIPVNGELLTVTKSELVLYYGNTVLERQALVLPAGEGEGSYELALASVPFPMPEMEDGSQLELWLEVTLSDGQTMALNGGSWYNNSGILELNVG